MATASAKTGSLSLERSGHELISEFRIGGISVQLVGVSGDDVALVTALEPFREESGSFDISLRVEWVRELVSLGRPRLFDSGTTWRMYEEGPNFGFDFTAPLFGELPYKRLLIDRYFRCGLIQLNEGSLSATNSSMSPLDYPLDELLIMHRLTQEKAIELHGSGIVRADGVGNLFVGHSGAGKSTTTRMWTEREHVEVLSDDRIIVRRDVSSPTRMRMYGTPWHGEAMYASPNSAPLARIFVLEHGHGNVITPLTPSQAVAELFARSFVPFHRHEYVDSALVFLEELANAVPVYRYAFEPDQRAVEKIRNFHD